MDLMGIDIGWAFGLAVIISAVAVFAIFKWGAKREGFVQWGLNSARTLVAKFEKEIKAYDAKNNTTYWDDVNGILADLERLQNREGDGALWEWITTGFGLAVKIERIIRQVGLVKYL